MKNTSWKPCKNEKHIVKMINLTYLWTLSLHIIPCTVLRENQMCKDRTDVVPCFFLSKVVDFNTLSFLSFYMTLELNERYKSSPHSPSKGSHPELWERLSKGCSPKSAGDLGGKGKPFPLFQMPWFSWNFNLFHDKIFMYIEWFS
jgi:hypothetical protein